MWTPPLPTLEPIRKQLKTVEHVIVMKDTPTPGSRRYAGVRGAAGRRTADGDVPTLAETDARHVLHLGHHRPPQGAVYTHRAIFLHSMASSMTDLLASTSATSSCTSCRCSRQRLVRAVRGVLNGATQIFGGPNPTSARHREIVHTTGDVRRRGPTVWIAIDRHPGIRAALGHLVHPLHPDPGGSAAPGTLIEKFDKKYGAPMLTRGA